MSRDYTLEQGKTISRVETLEGAARHEAMYLLNRDGSRTPIPLPDWDADRQPLTAFWWHVTEYTGSMWRVDPDREVFQYLRQKHPRARIEDPYRIVTCDLPMRPLLRIMDEVVIMLPSGYFVGYITRIQCDGLWYDLEIEEAALMMLRCDISMISRGEISPY